MPRKWLSVREASEHFGIPAKTFYSLLGRNLIPGAKVLRLGRTIRVDIQSVEESAIELKGNREKRQT